MSSDSRGVDDSLGGQVPHERILCFGNGRFLCAFLGEAVELGNRRGLDLGRIVMCTNTPRGDVSALVAAGCKYHVVSRGVRGGIAVETCTQVQAVSRALNSFQQWPELLSMARSPSWRVAVSNTTEAGITWQAEPWPTETSPQSFPARLAALLIERWRAGLPGVLVLPCELIDDNAAALRTLVLRHAQAWVHDASLHRWLGDEVRWCDTLVDRVVSGEPADAAAIRERLGEPDAILIAAERYHHWAIRGAASDAERFPLHRIGLATWCDDLAAERARKVRVLNGCHTALAAVAGDDTPLVRQAVDHPQYGPWLCRLVQEEILPGLAADGFGDAATLGAFADAVFDRLRNPNLDHRLADIRLNSFAKWRTRLLPTQWAADRRQTVAIGVAQSLAGLIRRADTLNDSQAHRVRALQSADPVAAARAIGADTALWGTDLTAMPGFIDEVARSLAAGPIQQRKAV